MIYIGYIYKQQCFASEKYIFVHPRVIHESIKLHSHAKIILRNDTEALKDSNETSDTCTEKYYKFVFYVNTCTPWG